MKRFASVKDCVKVFDTMRFTGDLLQKNFRKISNFSPFFLFFFEKCFRLRDGFFCCFQLRKNGFRDLCVSLRVFFGAIKLMEFQQCHFTLGSPYDFAYLVLFKSSQPSALVFAKHGFASVSTKHLITMQISTSYYAECIFGK